MILSPETKILLLRQPNRIKKPSNLYFHKSISSSCRAQNPLVPFVSVVYSYSLPPLSRFVLFCPVLYACRFGVSSLRDRSPPSAEYLRRAGGGHGRYQKHRMTDTSKMVDAKQSTIRIFQSFQASSLFVNRSFIIPESECQTNRNPTQSSLCKHCNRSFNVLYPYAESLVPPYMLLPFVLSCTRTMV